MSLSRPRFLLRLIAAVVFLATIGTWLATGAHRGWTKTQVTEMQRDEITGIDYPVQRDGLVAGVDIVMAGTGVAVLIAGASLFIGRRNSV